MTTSTQADYSLAKDGQIDGTPIGDTNQGPLAADDSFNTVYNSPNAACFVGVNFGDNTQADISKIRYAPNPAWAIAATKLSGAVF